MILPLDPDKDPLPTHLGGLQALADDAIVQRGDVHVLNGGVLGYLRCCFDLTPPLTVEQWIRGHGGYGSIYRRIPVAKQGDNDNRTWPGKEVTEEPEQKLDLAPVVPEIVSNYIPQGDQERKDAPMFRGLLGYFPAALFAVSAHSLRSDRKHNGAKEDAPYWARGKSSDHADCIMRHLIDAGGGFADNPDTEYHLTALAWRSLALLQEYKERKGAKPGVRSKF